MSDIVEQAAKVLSKNWRNMHTNEALGQQRMLAQALADAGLLADRTTPTRDEIAETKAEALEEAAAALREIPDSDPANLWMNNDSADWLRNRAKQIREGK